MTRHSLRQRRWRAAGFDEAGPARRWRAPAVSELVLCLALVTLGGAPARLAADPVHTGAPAGDAPAQAFGDELAQHPVGSAGRAAFVEAQIKAARGAVTAAVGAWADGTEPLASNAYAFLQNSGDISLLPLAKERLPSAPEAVARSLWLIGDAETELRRKVLLRVEALLADTRTLPVEANDPSRPRRVCDEAYVVMRRMVEFPESELKKAPDSRTFYASAPSARDALIRRARATPTWRRILDPNAELDGKQSAPPPPPRARPRFQRME